MKRHDFIVGTMVRIGFRTSLKGFDQFCKCVELYIDDPLSTIEKLYARVGARFGCSGSSVEKNLRHLFESSGASAAIGKLFGIDFVDTGNKEIVSMFSNYVLLHSDCYDSENDTDRLSLTDARKNVSMGRHSYDSENDTDRLSLTGARKNVSMGRHSYDSENDTGVYR